MFKIKNNYEFSFNRSGLLLVALIMLPNIIWSFLPPKNDILATVQSSPILDIIVSISRFSLMFSYIFTQRRNFQLKRISIHLSWVIWILFYYVCWIFYYYGFQNPFLLLLMALFPSLAFIVFGLVKRNWLGIIPSIFFLIFHLLTIIIDFF